MKHLSTMTLSILGAGVFAAALAFGTLSPQAAVAQDATAEATMDMSGMAMATPETSIGCPNSTFALAQVAQTSFGYMPPFDLSGFDQGQFDIMSPTEEATAMMTPMATADMMMTPEATLAILSNDQCAELLTSVTAFLDARNSASGTATAEPTSEATGEMMAPVAFIVHMSGPEEVPPADPDAVGTAYVVIRPATNEVCWSYNVAGMDLPASAAHIHKGAVGVSGPVVVPLSPADIAGAANGCATAAADVISAILADPSSYYVNVHNAAFPNGALRGNLLGL
jgi:hypothetical protein